MVETGDWTAPDLINYLVSAQHTLQPAEIEQLRDNPVFPEATTKQNKNEDGTLKVSKLKASDLYEPLDVFRSIGLPIIDWRDKDGRHKWRPSSKEGTCDTVWSSSILMPPPTPAEFLFSLGLRRHPSAEVILDIAAKGEPQRTAALDYFLDNYRQKYADYTATAYESTAFVPAIRRGEKELAKPLEVFASPDWQSLGFPILDPDLRRDAGNVLQIKEHPSTDQLVLCLEEFPPTTEGQAHEWFTILSRRMPGVYHSQSCKYVLIFFRFSQIGAGKIIHNAYHPYPRRFSRFHRPSVDAAKPMLLQG